MKFRGQHNEDRIAYHYFQRFSDASLRKTFLDVGAYDGADLSNSLVFEELGWKGICVEANSDIFPRLQANRRCLCLNVACSDQEGFANYYGEGRATPLGTIGGRAAEALNAVGKWNVDVKQSIRTTTVDRILEEYGMPEIDFVSIDVDGSEIEVLRGFDLRRAKPKLICIETNLDMVRQGRWPRALADEIHRVITEAGFHLMMVNGCNSFYSHDKLSAADRFVMRLREIGNRIAARLAPKSSGSETSKKPVIPSGV